jgi:hypothetical protein
MSRRAFRALVEIDRDDQVEELVRLAADAEIGLTVFEPDDGEHLDFVNVVDIEEREDGIYVFAERSDAERFAAAVDHDAGDDAVVEFHRAFVDEQALNVGVAAERLIAAERGDALEDVFGPALAEDVREGLPLTAALIRLREIGEVDSTAGLLIRRWIELDERAAAARGGAPR